MEGGENGSLSSRVSLTIERAGATTWVDSRGEVTILELIEIKVAWGTKPSDRWEGKLVKEPKVSAILDKIKRKATPHVASLYAAKLAELIYLDYRYGHCEKILISESGDRNLCNAPLLLPGLDGCKCSSCGWIYKPVDLASMVAQPSGKKQQRKQKRIEQVPDPVLPASQLELFGVLPEQEKDRIAETIEVWSRSTEEDLESASQELLEAYLED